MEESRERMSHLLHEEIRGDTPPASSTLLRRHVVTLRPDQVQALWSRDDCVFTFDYFDPNSKKYCEIDSVNGDGHDSLAKIQLFPKDLNRSKGTPRAGFVELMLIPRVLFISCVVFFFPFLGTYQEDLFVMNFVQYGIDDERARGIHNNKLSDWIMQRLKFYEINVTLPE